MFSQWLASTHLHATLLTFAALSGAACCVAMLLPIETMSVAMDKRVDTVAVEADVVGGVRNHQVELISFSQAVDTKN